MQMEGLLPLIYRTIRRKKTRRQYKCLSTGTASTEFEKFLLPPLTPEKFGEERKAHKRHRSLEDLSTKHFSQERPHFSRSMKGGNLRMFSCIGR